MSVGHERMTSKNKQLSVERYIKYVKKDLLLDEIQRPNAVISMPFQSPGVQCKTITNNT